jgi:glycyl-tRNA synthetase
MAEENTKLTIDELAMFCKRRGFVYPSGELYGSLSGFWDFGHLGAELKNNIKEQWWKFHVHQREDMVGIDGSIITNPKVWEASGHVENFLDIAVVCRKCGYKTKIDKHELGKVRCDKCSGEYESKGEFNPMFTTQVGPVKEDSVKAYLRPETAQLIFTNFKSVQDNARLKLPFGIAQIGKAFRNEISPREFVFRNREFEQMEIEYFTAPKQPCPYMDEIGDIEIEILTEEMQKKNKPGKTMKIVEAHKKGLIKTDWHAYFLSLEFSWFLFLGANPEKFRARQHSSEERSHYATDTWDLEYNFPMGWRELQGFANRSDFDLKQHEKFSKKSMAIQDEEFGKVIPHVVCEPSLGVERTFLVFLLDAYEYDKKRENIVLHLSPKLAPYKAAIFPLISKGEIFEMSREIYKDLLEEFNVLFDKSGSIGRRYARNDEVGTPFCITIDGQSVKDKTVTIRDRDTTKQIRAPIFGLKETLRKLINDEISFEDAGSEVK